MQTPFHNMKAKETQTINPELTKLSSEFASGMNRFSYKVDQSPGPGDYEYKTSNFKLPEYHINRHNYTSLIKKEHQWILGSGRGSFITVKGNCGVGPGSYEDPQGRHELALGRTNWGRS
jgi:hypothetical protein